MPDQLKPSILLADFRFALARQGQLETELRELRAKQGERLERLKTLFPLGTHRRFIVGSYHERSYVLVNHDREHGLFFTFEAFEKFEDLKWPEPGVELGEPIDLSFDETAPASTLRLPHEPAPTNILDDEVA